MTAISPRRVHIVGIGAGEPAHLTAQAVAAIGELDVVLVADKGAVKDELTAVRRGILEQVRPGGGYQLVEVPDPDRGPDAQRDGAAYRRGVSAWHAARAERYAAIIDQLPPQAVVGFLVWGDPAFYDSTIRVVRAIGERIPLELTVVPGISAFQALAAAHGIVLHEVGQPVHITTGRRLVDEWHPGLGTVVVMLDGALACQGLVERAPGLRIHWGAYVGMPHQQLRSGRLGDVIDEIVTLRAHLRAEHGWVMDVYALSPPAE